MKTTLKLSAFTLLLAATAVHAQGSGAPGGSGMSDAGAGPGNTQPLGGPGDNASGKRAVEREASRNVTPATMPQHSDIPPSAAAKTSAPKNHPKPAPPPARMPQSSPGG